MSIVDEINALKRERKAAIFAHNYCRAEVQEIADFTGDSLELARKATQTNAETIVFCGVYFMAETAKILNPDKKVLIPDTSAGCPMADMITGAQLRELKAAHPGAKAVCYVNSTAEVKAECDICVTSGNAEKVMKTFSADDEILFVPDRHLGKHIADALKREYILWQGCCPIHAALTVEAIEKARAAHPGAPVLVHGECAQAVRDAADEILSTGGMCAYAKTSQAKTILVGTEVGILHRLRKENPDKEFFAVDEGIVCADMKKATLEKVRDALRDMSGEVIVSDAISTRARLAIEAMLRI